MPKLTGDAEPRQTWAGRGPELRRFVRFLAVGVLNTLFGYLVFAAFVLLGAPNYIAVAGMTALGCLFNYFSIGLLVFGHRGLRRLGHFIASYVVVGTANWLLLEGVVRFLGFSPLVGQLFCIPVMALLSFVLQRNLVFRPSP